MLCRFCLQDKKLIKAHIIPRAFFESMRSEDKKNIPFQILTNSEDGYPKKSQIGIYDNKILCRECENIFQKYDDYGQKLLLKDIHKESRNSNDNLEGWVVDEFNYSLLKNFLLGVMWRASVSNQCSRCCLGEKYEKVVKDIIINQGLNNDNFDCIIVRHNDYFGKNYLLDPVSKTKFSNQSINFTTVYLGAGYKIFIKVDQKNLDKDDVFNKIVLKSENPIYILRIKDFINSKEYEIFNTMI